MRTIVIGAILALAALDSPAHATEASYAQCQKAANGVDPQLKACDAAEIASRDAVLNQTYRRLIAMLSAPRQNLLRASERSWVAFRDSECEFRRSAEAGGSDAGLVYNRCRLDLTARRVDDLNKVLTVAKF